MGYIGGGIMLAINLAMIMIVPTLYPAEMQGEITGLMTRLAFVTVGIWWFVFTIPLLRNVSEPVRRIMPGEEQFNPLQASFKRLGQTFRDIRHYRDLALFLLAFWVYANGIGTIITMSTIYGAEIGLGQTTLIGTLLMVQFLGAPFAILFGRLAKKIGTKPAIYLSLGVYTLISILAYFMRVEWHFWALGVLVATVQGGSQALSRSLMGKMMPKSKSAEFYGFFSVFEKFANVAGPLLFGIVSTLMGASRLSIVSLIIFFVVGAAILTSVNVERGIQSAAEDEQQMITTNEAAVAI
jgi:UMF1 family MFS transporter